MEQPKVAISELIFPSTIGLAQYGGDFSVYFKAVYKSFEDDFVRSHVRYNGQRVSAQRIPLEDGMHKTFYHITHEGSDEKNRTPAMRRLERIGYIKFMIESCPHPDLLIWENTREGSYNKRILIYCPKEKHLVILFEKRDFYLLCTAYEVDNPHTERKLLKEYESYIKTKPAQ